MPIVWANSVLIVALAVLGEAGLSYFGLGDPDAFSWGTLLYNGFQAGAINQGAWWYVVPPGRRDHALRARVLRRRPGRRATPPTRRRDGRERRPVLRVDDLRVGYARARRRRRDRLGRLLRAAARRGARPRRRVGLRQDDDGARDHAAARARACGSSRGRSTCTPTNGVVHVHRRTERGMRDLRWSEISLVFQGALNALDPVQRVSRQIGDAIRLHDPEADRPAVRERVTRTAGARRHQRRARRPVPARVLGRHAPARDDRPGAGLRARGR